MSCLMCERCDGGIDTDFDCELLWTDTGAIHWDCLTAEEQEEEEAKEEAS